MRAAVCICLLLTGATYAQAQDASVGGDVGPEEIAVDTPGHAPEDSRLFNAGVAAIADQRFADARDFLRRALALSPRMATAFNLAIALRGTGEVAEGVRLLEALRAGEYGTLDEGQLAQVDVLRRELTPELAQLRIETTPQAEVRIDAEVQARGEWIRLDPGDHVVEARAEGFLTRIERIELARGARQSLTLELEPPPIETRPSRAWIWVLAGVVVVGAAALAIGLSVRGDPEPVSDPVFGNTEALSWR